MKGEFPRKSLWCPCRWTPYPENAFMYSAQRLFANKVRQSRGAQSKLSAGQ
jgi:hypothetical protein